MVKPKRVFDKNLLDEVLKRDNANLVGEYSEKLKRGTKITFICKCGKQDIKSFTLLVDISCSCRQCTIQNMLEKTKKTNIKRYGCEDPNQLSETKEKIKEVFKEKYGCDSPMKTDTIKNKMKNIFIEKYGVENPFQSETVKEKIKESLINKYGVEHPLQADQCKEKFKQTLLENYGVEVPYHNNDLKQKGKETCLERYGVEYSLQNKEIRDKVKNTCLERYGVENPLQNKEIKNKSKNTCLERYGVENPSQSQEVMIKNQNCGYKYKDYKMPSGSVRRIQGYEHYALDELVKIYSEEQILTDRKDIPRILYKENEKERYYFPDIYIPHENTIIEVKSVWTASSLTDCLDEKKQACLDKGYKFEMWVYTPKGERVK